MTDLIKFDTKEERPNIIKVIGKSDLGVVKATLD